MLEFIRRFLTKLKRNQLTLFLWDIFFISLALFLAYLIRFEGKIPDMYTDNFWVINTVFVLSFLAAYRIMGLYNSLWNYASIDEMISVILGVTLGTALSGLVIYGGSILVPRSIILMMWFINVIFAGGSRMGFRVVRRVFKKTSPQNMKKTLIMGAGSAGSMVLKELKENRDKLNSEPVGFIDDDPAKDKKKIHGLPVLGNRTSLPRLIREKSIDEVIMAIPTASRQDMRKIIDTCKNAGVKVKTLPGVYELINGHIKLEDIREVDIEDLLGREPVKVNMEEIAGYLQGERVLVTGAGGSIGSELCRQIIKFNPEALLLLGRGENSIFDINTELEGRDTRVSLFPIICDVKDRQALERVFVNYRPTVIFHAAAHKHVPLMEDNPVEAVKNNIFGTSNMVELADVYEAKRFVLVSTDKAVNPTSVMGTTKRISEMVMQAVSRASATKYCAVRFGNVLGSRGSVVPLFKKQIARGGPVTITHPQMTRYFMTITEAVQLVIQAGAMGEKGDIFVLDMGEPVKILDMAEDLIKLSGFEPHKDIEVMFTGIRPGEKLFEELLTSREKVSATKHERIFTAEADEINLQKFRREFWHKINEITEDPGALRERLHKIISN